MRGGWRRSSMFLIEGSLLCYKLLGLCVNVCVWRLSWRQDWSRGELLYSRLTLLESWNLCGTADLYHVEKNSNMIQRQIPTHPRIHPVTGTVPHVASVCSACDAAGISSSHYNIVSDGHMKLTRHIFVSLQHVDTHVSVVQIWEQHKQTPSKWFVLLQSCVTAFVFIMDTFLQMGLNMWPSAHPWAQAQQCTHWLDAACIVAPPPWPPC